MSELNNFDFFFIISALIIFCFFINSEDFIQKTLFKSDLDFNTLSKQPNRKKLLQKKELYFYALTDEERQKAIKTMVNFIKSQIVLDRNINKEYLIYDKSLISRFDSPVAFYFAQCELDCFEENGLVKSLTQFSLSIPKNINLKTLY